MSHPAPEPSRTPDLPSRQVRNAWQWLDQQRDRIAQTLIRWCNQNSWSYSPQALAAMAARLEEDFRPLGLPAAQVELPLLSRRASGNSPLTEQPTGPGLIWQHRPETPRRFLMVIHYDTVYPPAAHREVKVVDVAGPSIGPHAAQKPGRPAPQRFVGPGVADAKGGIAVIRFAAEALLRFDIGGDWGWTIALNPDEEIGSPASAAWLAGLAPQFEFGLVFEPSLPDEAMVANRKGTGNWRFLIGGRSAHAGRNPQEGRNAVVHAARLADELDRLSDFDSGLTVNVARFIGGEALNQVPAEALLELNVRVVAQDQADQIEAALRRLADQFAAADGYTCSLEGGFHSPPKRIDHRYAALHQQLAQAAGWLGREIRWRDTGGACDGSKLAAAGLINVDTMGPVGGHLHSDEEYCDFDTLLTAAKTLVNLVAIRAAERDAA